MVQFRLILRELGLLDNQLYSVLVMDLLKHLNRLFPCFETPHFDFGAKCKIVLVKVSFINTTTTTHLYQTALHVTSLLNRDESEVAYCSDLRAVFSWTPGRLACENIRFSSLFAAGDVSRETSQRRRERRNGCFRRLLGAFHSANKSSLKFRNFHSPSWTVHSGCTDPTQATAHLVIILVSQIQNNGTGDKCFVKWKGTFRSDRPK